MERLTIQAHVIRRNNIAACSITRFGPNRIAADMEGNGELDFWRIFENVLENFWRFFEEFWRNWFVVRRKDLPSIGDLKRK